MGRIIGALAFWLILGCSIFLVRPQSYVHQTTVTTITRKNLIRLTVLVVLFIVLVSFSMTLSPVWNGEIPGQKNQYEMITESFLQGRLDFDYDVDPLLLTMDDPYDRELRMALGVQYPWDHAFYHGKFYMYFGVVPVFLAFLPFRLLFGYPLLSCYATMLFSALFLAGFSVYSLWLSKHFFPKLSWGLFLSLFIAFSSVSIVYVAKFPSLYQTPVSCGMMLEVWSFYFFSRAVFEKRTKWNTARWLAAGALLGALSFGCRPPVALANLAVIPLLIHFLRHKRISLPHVIFTIMPYVAVAAGLMWYNQVRFDNPFEFGQSYQLTIIDQTSYGRSFTLETLVSCFVSTVNTLLRVREIATVFPYLQEYTGVFAICPLLLYNLLFLSRRQRSKLKRKSIFGFILFIPLSMFIISSFQFMWSPRFLERYHSDYLWLLCIGAFLQIGFVLEDTEDLYRKYWLLSLAAFACTILSVLVFLIPQDGSYTDYFPDALKNIWYFITFRARIS